MKDTTNCLFCHDTPETNNHLWTCPDTRSLIVDCFITLGNILIDLLRNHADKLSLVISDSVKFSPTFRWAYRNEEIHPVALLLLKSYITNDLVGIFRSHFNTSKTILRLLLPFMHTCSISFKSVIWQARNSKWKNLRSELGLSKASFKTYYKDFKHLGASNNDDIRQEDHSNRRARGSTYVNPFNDYRNFKLQKDFLFILFTSSNFLHSGPFFKHVECNNYINYPSHDHRLTSSIYNV